MVVLRAEEVLGKFSLYSEEQPRETPRWELCRALCGECGEWIGQEARPGAENGRERLEALAAAEAFYQLTLLDEALTPDSLAAPELKLEMGKRSEKARQLAQEKRLQCGGLLREQGFYFGGMKA